MTGNNQLDEVYVTQMRYHGYGRAMYKPVSTSSFHPGTVGYFDKLGNWNPIADLSAIDARWPETFTPPPSDKLVVAPVETQTWGPKTGKETKSRSIEFRESVSLTAFTGVPLEAGSCFRIESSESEGAALLVDGVATHHRYHYEAPFKEWIKENAKSILKERPEVKDHDLWVVTSTWSAAEASINCWSGTNKSVDIGINAKVAEIGEVAPNVGWHHAGESEGWIRVKGDEVSLDRAYFELSAYLCFRRMDRK